MTMSDNAASLTCTGDHFCEASPHVHGCFADWQGDCDDPTDHERPTTPQEGAASLVQDTIAAAVAIGFWTMAGGEPTDNIPPNAGDHQIAWQIMQNLAAAGFEIVPSGGAASLTPEDRAVLAAADAFESTYLAWNGRSRLDVHDLIEAVRARREAQR